MVFFLSGGVAPVAYGERSTGPHGSTSGAMNANPAWSLGLQLGNYGGTGVAAQNFGVSGGALNAGLGFAERGLAIHCDYVLFLDDDFNFVKLQKNPGYNGFRGHVSPYFGGGVQVGRGISLRVPAGVQYSMLKDPFNFYGGLVLMLGSFLADEDLGVNLGIFVGTRLLL